MSCPPRTSAITSSSRDASTVYGAQGETVTAAHVLVGDNSGAGSAYVGMTRGRTANTAHLVAESVEDARAQWVAVFSRDRADLGPTHATRAAAEDVDRYGAVARDHSVAMQRAALKRLRDPEPHYPRAPYSSPSRPGRGIGR